MTAKDSLKDSLKDRLKDRLVVKIGQNSEIATMIPIYISQYKMIYNMEAEQLITNENHVK